MNQIFREDGAFASFSRLLAQRAGQRFGHRESSLGKLDGRRENLGERARAVGLGRELHGADRARHADRQRPFARQAALGSCRNPRWPPSGRSPCR